MKRMMPSVKKTLLLVSVGILLCHGAAMEYPLFAGETVQVEFPVTLSGAVPRKWGGAGCSLLQENGAWVVTLGGGDSWPGVAFSPPGGGNWDFSGWRELRADIENLDPEGQCEIHGRIYTLSKDGGEKFSVFNAISLNPGEKRVLKVPFGRISPDSAVALPKLKAFPDGVRGVPNICPERVFSISFYARAPFLYGRNGTVKIRVSNVRLAVPFHCVAAPVGDPEKFFPFVDRYGQYVHGEWPEKIKSDADLAARRRTEAAELAALPEIASRSRYGGWEAGPSLRATGFFRTEKYRGKWYLVDPEGKLFISFGMNGVHFNGVAGTRNRESWFAVPPEGSDSINFAARNLERKYGAQWASPVREAATERLKKWGVNTVGAWSDTELCRLRKMPYTVILNDWSPVARLGSTATYAKFHDAFDPAFAENLDRLFQERFRWSIDDPWCLGYFINNELQFGKPGDFAEYTLTRGADSPAKQAFRSHLEQKYGDVAKLNRAWGSSYADWEDFTAATAPKYEKTAEAVKRDLVEFSDILVEQYYRACRDAVRRNAPNQLYLGSRFRGTIDLQKPKLAATAARYCDVLSVNCYTHTVAHLTIPEGLPDVPVMIGEYSFLVRDRGLFNHTLVPAGTDQRDRAEALLHFWRGALSHPNLVGAHWFYYRDQLLTGRNDGENYPLGFVDICDTPYPEITGTARRINEEMYRRRLYGNLKSEDSL